MSTGANAPFSARASNLRIRSDIDDHLVASNARVFQEKIETALGLGESPFCKPARFRILEIIALASKKSSLTLHEVSAKKAAMKQLFRLTITTCASIALALTAFGGPAPSGKEMKQVAPAPAPECSWTGFYIGLNGGGLWSNEAVHTTSRDLFGNGDIFPPDGVLYGEAAADLATFSLSDDYASFIGGGQMGYNWEFWRIVLGPEVDIQGVTEGDHHASATSSITPDPVFSPENPITQDATVSRRMDWLGTVRGRIGFTITPCLLIYGTGGLAYGEVDARTSIRQFVENTDGFLPNVYGGSGSFSSTQSGWCAGGGLEFMFWKRWSVKAEYLYFDLGTASWHVRTMNNFTSEVPPELFTSTAPTSHTKFDGNIVRAGLNFHF